MSTISPLRPATHAEPTAVAASATRSRIAELSLIACWINVVVAAFAQMATLPSRTYGLALITEPLLKDLEISRTTFGQLNLWATVVTALLSFGYGTFLKQTGIRRTYLVMMVALAGATVMLTVVNGFWPLLLAMTLARVIGQGVLALVSTSMVGLSFPRRIPVVMAVYSIVGAFVFMALIKFVQWGMSTDASGGQMNWREVWWCLAGIMAFGLAPFGYFAISEPTAGRKTLPDAVTATPEVSEAPLAGVAPERTLWQAMRTPIFIVFGLSCLIGGSANSGLALFNESILKDCGLSRNVFFDSLTIGIVAAVLFKFVGGWLCDKWSIGKMAAISILVYAGTYAVVPFLQTPNQAYAWSVAKSMALAVHTVIYYSIWSYAFGRKDLQQIQGAAHVLTITANGIGPPIFGWWRDTYHSYEYLLYICAAANLVIGLLLWFVPVPRTERPREVTA